MPTFASFDTPASLTDLPGEARALWSTFIAEHTEQFAFVFDRFFDPLSPDAPAQPIPVSVIWSASPARLLRTMTPRQRWAAADSTRDEQDEYCEWRVTRDPQGRLTKVVFSTEVPEYYAHIAETSPSVLLDLYRDLVSADVVAEDLVDESGVYLPDNKWNGATSSGIVHLRQGSNTLLAALRLAAKATVQRVGASGERITDRRELVLCGQLGEPLRNSDPQIADIVNDAVFAGSAISLADPLGLYLDGLQTPAFQTPDGQDTAQFWTVERGNGDHVVRARFEVPDGFGYVLGDLTVDERPLEFGTQVADKVKVRLDALLGPSDSPLTTKPCGT